MGEDPGMSEEFTGRYHDGWVSRRFVAPLRRVKKESVAIIKARRFPYPETLTLSVYVNGERVLVKKDPAGSFTMKVPIPPVRKGRLEILADQTFVPKEKGHQ